MLNIVVWATPPAPGVPVARGFSHSSKERPLGVAWEAEADSREDMGWELRRVFREVSEGGEDKLLIPEVPGQVRTEEVDPTTRV